MRRISMVSGYSMAGVAVKPLDHECPARRQFAWALAVGISNGYEFGFTDNRNATDSPRIFPRENAPAISEHRGA
jgi:hypothetical protein